VVISNDFIIEYLSNIGTSSAGTKELDLPLSFTTYNFACARSNDSTSDVNSTTNAAQRGNAIVKLSFSKIKIYVYKSSTVGSGLSSVVLIGY
jgi:hypothetical protein